MDRPTGLESQGYRILHGSVRSAGSHSHGIRLGTHGGLRTHPDDVIYLYVVRE
jgi:hypothetical protein